MYKLWDFHCVQCTHTWEALVEKDESNPNCEVCGGPSARGLYAMGTAHRAQIDPAKQAEIMSKTRHMQLRQQGRLPWRKNSYSQTGNE